MANPIYRTPTSIIVDTSSNKITISKDNVIAAETPMLSLQNNTAGVSGTPQFSPALELVTQGYSGSASVINKFSLQGQSVSGTWNYTGRSGDGYLSFNAVYNNGSAAQVGLIDGYGNMLINGFGTFIGTSTNVLPTPWTAVTFQNSYANLSGGNPCGYMKDAAGFVRLRGAASAGTANAVVFTLPVGFRPDAAYYFTGIVDGTDASGGILLGADGTIKANGGGGNTSIYFDGIKFYAQG